MAGGPMFSASYNKSISNQTLKSINTVMQNIENKCSFVCGNKSNNNVIIIEDSTDSNFNFDQTCSVVGTSCTARTYLETDIQNILSAQSDQENKNKFSYFDFAMTDSESTISETTRNNVSQMVSNFCQATSLNDRNSNYFYIKNSKGSNFSFAQTGSVNNSQCSFDVTSKVSILNQETAKSTQKNQNGGGIFSFLIGMIAFVIIISVLMSIIHKKNGDDNKKLLSGKSPKEDEKEEKNIANTLAANNTPRPPGKKD